MTEWGWEDGWTPFDLAGYLGVRATESTATQVEMEGGAGAGKSQVVPSGPTGWLAFPPTTRQRILILVLPFFKTKL